MKASIEGFGLHLGKLYRSREHRNLKSKEKQSSQKGLKSRTSIPCQHGFTFWNIYPPNYSFLFIYYYIYLKYYKKVNMKCNIYTYYQQIVHYKNTITRTMTNIRDNICLFPETTLFKTTPLLVWYSIYYRYCITLLV